MALQLGKGNHSKINEHPSGVVKNVRTESAEAIGELLVSSACKHPHLMRYTSASVQSDSLNLLMPRYQRDMRAVKLEPAQAAVLGAQIAGALAHMHSKGFIHGDVKPDNILFDGSNYVLCDFGLAAPNTRERLIMPLQTAEYRAPEIDTNAFTCVITAKTDVWALGCTLYRLLVGEPLVNCGIGYAFKCNREFILKAFGASDLRQLLALSPADVRSVLHKIHGVGPDLLNIITQMLVPAEPLRLDAYRTHWQLAKISGMQPDSPAVEHWTAAAITRYDLAPYLGKIELSPATARTATALISAGMLQLSAVLTAISFHGDVADVLDSVERLVPKGWESDIVAELVGLMININNLSNQGGIAGRPKLLTEGAGNDNVK